MKFKEFLVLDQRKSGNRKAIQMVDSAKLGEFLKAVASDAELSAEDKVLIGGLAASGLRISELLAVRRCDIEVVGEDVFFKAKALKKDAAYTRKCKEALARGETLPARPNAVIRQCKFPDAMRSYVLEVMMKRRGFERLLKVSRNQALIRMKQLFGEHGCNHMMRHSFISFLVHKGESTQVISDMVAVVEDTILSYVHTTDKKGKLKSFGF